MSIARRVFLEWNKPGLPAVAQYLLQQYSVLGLADLSNIVVVLPGKRAGRRLLEILVELAADDQFTPPQITTVGRLPELLYESKKPFATDFVQKLAWAEALRSIGDRIQSVIPVLPARDDIDRWLSLGEMLWRTHRELAADGLNFDDVVDRGPQVDGFAETRRWTVLREVQQAYLQQLDRLELWDMQTARLFAVEYHECRTDREIVLAGTVDMNRAMRQMLAQVGDRVTALVHAPKSLTRRFDEFGCLKPEAWQNIPLDLDTRNVRVVDGPADQADAVARTLADFGGQFRADDITIGVADESLVPQIQRQLEQCEVPTRWVVGKTLSETGPYRLLMAIAQYLERGRFDDFSSLVRHPDLSNWVDEQGIAAELAASTSVAEEKWRKLPACESDESRGKESRREQLQNGQPRTTQSQAGSLRHGDQPHWLRQLDDYYARHLQPRLGFWLGNEKYYSAIQQVHETVDALLQPFREGKQPLGDWTEPIVSLVLNVYANRQFELDEDADRMHVDACKRIHQTLVEHTSIPADLMPKVSAADAIRLTLQQISSHPIPSAANDAAVELLGWLELPLDDAPALVVTTFNEGHVPKSLNADLFLPNRLRKQLGVDDNARRYARDAYALSVLLHSRESLTLIVGRRDANNDPLRPSRLLFAAKPQAIAARVLAFYDTEQDQESLPPLAGALTSTREDSAFIVPKPEPLPQPIERMSVTSFRTYLVCPYRFYLRHALRLGAAHDDARELDGMAFGNLTHEVLKRFGLSDYRNSQDPRELKTYLHRTLDECVEQWYGKDRLAPVNVQIMQLRSRLDAFAEWQAEWAAQGWEIAYAEVSFAEHAVGLKIGEDRYMQLDGRVDRIDRHRDSNTWVVFDYKTGDSGVSPQMTHRRRGEWADLQLPLYRHLARSLGITGNVQLGYIVLPKDTSQVDCLIADWSEADLNDADAVARTVARLVAEEEFWPPQHAPRGWFEEYAAICQDAAFDRRLEADSVA